MSFSSIPSFRSGTASPSKTPATAAVQSQLQNVLSPSSLSNRSSSPAPSRGDNQNTNMVSFIPWTTSQGKLYKSIGEEAWKKCEKTVISLKNNLWLTITNTFSFLNLEC